MQLVLEARAQDEETAFDSVEHVDALVVLSEAGATPHQVLALAREMEGTYASLKVPGIAQTDQLPMTRALKTGGRIEPMIFARMFDEVWDAVEGEWDVLGWGSSYQTQGSV